MSYELPQPKQVAQFKTTKGECCHMILERGVGNREPRFLEEESRKS
jgi:hypothetical protein